MTKHFSVFHQIVSGTFSSVFVVFDTRVRQHLRQLEVVGADGGGEQQCFKVMSDVCCVLVLVRV